MGMTTFSVKTNSFGSGLSGLLLILAVGLLAGGCSEVQKEAIKKRSETRQRVMAEKVLSERASLYWDLVRWRKWDDASSFFENAEDRVAFLRKETGAEVGPTMDDVEFKYVVVSPENPNEGEVRLTWTEVVLTTGAVGSGSATQYWYRKGPLWWVRPPSEQPGGAMDEEPPFDLPTEVLEEQPATSPPGDTETTDE